MKKLMLLAALGLFAGEIYATGTETVQCPTSIICDSKGVCTGVNGDIAHFKLHKYSQCIRIQEGEHKLYNVVYNKQYDSKEMPAAEKKSMMQCNYFPPNVTAVGSGMVLSFEADQELYHVEISETDKNWVLSTNRENGQVTGGACSYYTGSVCKFTIQDRARI